VKWRPQKGTLFMYYEAFLDINISVIKK
jgi:hypothetical protein